ncbi:MAG: alpha/beta hydrolase [Gammaproteobacteria bacterium]|nr:alpha/beta hydrolase [Gammaproteobacteria bacterium]
MTTISSSHVHTSDGVRLHYLEAGTGAPLVLIPGWSQTAAEFRYQLEALSAHYRCIAIDMRGHGESENVEFGYRVARFAKDLHDVLTALGLDDVNLLGHSMGCGVIWAYWDLFGSERLARLILVDESPCITINPGWDDEERRASGATLTGAQVMDQAAALAGPGGGAATDQLLGIMVTDAMDEETRAWLRSENYKTTRPHAAALFADFAHHDWRDVVRRIDIPTLLIGGKASLIPYYSIEALHAAIPGSELVIFEADEGGAHFMFVESPAQFNEHVRRFIG